MLSFWRSRPTIDADEIDWIVEHWVWLNVLLGPVNGNSPRMPVFPARETFPDAPTKHTERARYYFDRVRDAYGIPANNCELVAQAHRPDLGASIVFGSMKQSGALGTFQPRGNIARITYDPALIDSPLHLIATFAHELAHLKLEYRTNAPPGGDETMEPLTDLATVHMGFGLFGANVAFEYSQTQDYDRQGWQWKRAGYLTEPQWCFANALAFELNDVPEGAYAAWAKPSVAAGIRKNRAYLKAHPNLIAHANAYA